MHPETERHPTEIKRLGNLEIERDLSGEIIRLGEVLIEKDDKILLVQRHQKPEPSTKEDLLATDKHKTLNNLDFTYDPATTSLGTSTEKQLLEEVRNVLGPIDIISTTPMKRGQEHLVLLQAQFPEATENQEVNQLLSDAEIGLIGESFYGGYSYDQQESETLFNTPPNKAANFGKKDFSYMKTWVNQAYLDPENRWKAETPEELQERTKKLIDLSKNKNYFITHDANSLAFHLLADRTTSEIEKLIEAIELPQNIRQSLLNETHNFHNYGMLITEIRAMLENQTIPGFHFKKVITEFFEHLRLKSGEDQKGYGAISIYVVKASSNGNKQLIEVMYDQQV